MTEEKGLGHYHVRCAKSQDSSKADEGLPIQDDDLGTMKGMPHTIRIERRDNELVVHLALLDGPHAKLPHGVLLHSEGWVDIGYGLKMFLVIGSANTTYRPRSLEEKRGLLKRLFAGRQPPPEAKSSMTGSS